MPLDYNYTCGDLDDAIKSSEEIIIQGLRYCIEEMCPKLTEATVNDMICEYDVSGQVADEFEVLRGVNEDMRDQANVQISDLEDEVSALEYELADYQEQVSNLETDIGSLEDQLKEES